MDDLCCTHECLHRSNFGHESPGKEVAMPTISQFFGIVIQMF